jgi:hypothetical protein
MDGSVTDVHPDSGSFTMYMISEGAVKRRRALTLDDFQERFVQICRSHQAQGRAWAFAFLLYDFTHPHLRRLLSEDSYWDDLDQISGRDLTVFSFHCPPERLTIQSHEAHGAMYGIEVKRFYSIDPPGSNLVWKYFDGSEIRPPCVLFFQVADDRVIDSLSIRLRKDTLEEAHKELRSILKTAVDALSKLNPEYDPAPQDVFNLVKGAVTQQQQFNAALRVAKPLLGVVRLGSLLDFAVRLVGR